MVKKKVRIWITVDATWCKVSIYVNGAEFVHLYTTAAGARSAGQALSAKTGWPIKGRLM